MKFLQYLLAVLLILSPTYAYSQAVYVPTTASEIDTDTTNFDTNLSSADDTVQKALDTLDDVAGGGGTECSTSSCDLNASTTLNSQGICLADGTDCPAAGSGDVTGVGDCADGACLDGSSDGGGYARLYDGDSHYGQIDCENLSDNRTITIPNASGIIGLLDDSKGNGDTSYSWSADKSFDQLALKAPLTSPTFQTSINGAYFTASELLITDASKNIISAAVATYPSLAELAYVKGVTSAVQTQINGKQATVTEGSLADSVIVSADIKDGTIAGGDLSSSIAITTTGKIDAGGGDFEMPNGAEVADPNAAGEVAVDTTTDQFLYYGSAQRVLTYQLTECKTIEDPVDADDNITLFGWKEASTITDVWCETQGGGTIPVVLSDGTNALESITCSDAGQEDDGSIANGTFTARERVEVDFGAPSGTVDWCTICVTRTVDAD